MKLLLYPIIIFAITFLLQLFFIIITERNREADEEIRCKSKRIVKKVLIALVISLTLAVAISAFFMFVIFFWSWTLE